MSTGSAYKEGTVLASLGSTNSDRGYERKPGSTSGHGTDTDNNVSDFQLLTPSNPQNSSSTCIGVVTNPTLSINDISLNEGDSGTTSFVFTVSLSAPAGAGGVTFDIATADNTATDADNDYEPKTLTSQTISEGQTQTTFSVDVNGDTTAESNETFFVNVTNVTGATAGDVQGQGTIQNDDFAVTLISAIQGATDSSPLDGQTVMVEAIVVADFQDYTSDPPNELSGFILQEEDADVDLPGNNTSEGIFVFDGQNPAVNVAVGDKVRVIGTVDEFGDAADANPATIDTITQLVGPLTVQILSSGNALPTPASIDLPVSALADYEKYESMLVTFVDELTVTEIFTLGRFGEVLLAAGGRLDNPTAVAEPGAPAQAVRDANILRSITLDDGLTNQNPDPLRYPEPGGLSATNTLRGGDTTTGLTGVMHYLDATEDFRIQPTGPITWNHVNPRPADAPEVDGSLKVVGSNTLNYFTTIDPNSNDSDSFAADDVCGPNYDGVNTSTGMECRGADSAAEFTRQHDKLINMLLELDADIIGLNELENNASAAPANDDSDPVLESIVDALNAAPTPDTYAFIDAGTIGTDAIKVGLIYKSNRVTPVGSFEILTSAYDPDFIDTRNRPVLAQTFEDANGGVLTVAVAHLKSKGCPDEDELPDGDPNYDQGDGQGCWNPVRTAAAEVMVDWFTDYIAPTSGDPDILLVGDLNSYAKEDPIDVLVNAGYVDLASTLPNPYSYVFDGEWGYLDYAMASPSLVAQVAGVAEWHINADEPIVLDYNLEFKSDAQDVSFYSPLPFRVSDHDPILVGLNLTVTDPDVYVTTTAAGSVDGIDFDKNDILLHNTDGDWSLFFDGAAAGLPAKTDFAAIHVNGADDLYLSFTQTNLVIPGFGKVNGSDVVHYDGGLSWYFDGSDVDLTTGNEKVDGLHILPGSAAPVPGCVDYLLISTRGKGRVSNPGEDAILFSGEDVLGFCATSLGLTTDGYWFLVLDGSAQGMPNNATISLAANADGTVIYLTTRSTFSVDGATGGHSMVYKYDTVTETFSGPYFSAPAAGLTQTVDGLHLSGMLP